MWLTGRPRTTILLQRDQSFGEMLDQVHFSCRCLWRIETNAGSKRHFLAVFLTTTVFFLSELTDQMPLNLLAELQCCIS